MTSTRTIAILDMAGCNLGADQQTQVSVTMWRVAQGVSPPRAPRTVRELSANTAPDVRPPTYSRRQWDKRELGGLGRPEQTSPVPRGSARGAACTYSAQRIR